MLVFFAFSLFFVCFLKLVAILTYKLLATLLVHKFRLQVLSTGVEEPLDLIRLSLDERIYVKMRNDREVCSVSVLFLNSSLWKHLEAGFLETLVV